MPPHLFLYGVTIASATGCLPQWGNNTHCLYIFTFSIYNKLKLRVEEKANVCHFSRYNHQLLRMLWNWPNLCCSGINTYTHITHILPGILHTQTFLSRTHFLCFQNELLQVKANGTNCVRHCTAECPSLWFRLAQKTHAKVLIKRKVSILLSRKEPGDCLLV